MKSLLSAYIGVCVRWLGRRYLELQPYVVATLMAIVLFFCVLMVFALLALSACINNDPIQPTSTYPCGPFGVVCETQHTCCPDNNTCGGEPASTACPVGECCFIGAGTVEARLPMKQRPQK